MSTQRYDAIVIGVGGMGSAACWSLAKRGARVLGIEQHDVGHALGSSHGETRLIRQAYFEHPAYVPLLKSAYKLWDEVNAAVDKPIFHRTGLVIYGPPSCPTLAGVRRSSAEHGISIVEHDAVQAATLHPGFSPPSGFAAITEPAAGYLEVEGGVRTLAALACKRGAVIREHQTVTRFHERSGSVIVETTQDRYEAAKLIITAGPWSKAWLPGIASKLRVCRVPLFWFRAPEIYSRQRGVPCFGFEMPEGFYYGLPDLDGRGLKVGLHVPGDVVERPEDLDRSLRPIERDGMAAFLRRCLPQVEADKMLHHAVCMYTMTPDEHFVIDTDGLVSYAAGFSGHGYKFATVMGEVLADLALDGRTQHPVDFLKPRW